mgnify:CR=1 FL=1
MDYLGAVGQAQKRAARVVDMTSLQQAIGAGTEVPEELASSAPPPVVAGSGVGTPMAERVATIGLLNKRNNLSQDIEMKPGESRRIGNVVVRLSACEKTAPWEANPEEGAFVQVLVRERADADYARASQFLEKGLDRDRGHVDTRRLIAERDEACTEASGAEGRDGERHVR